MVSKQRSGPTRRRANKKKFLNKLEIMGELGTSRTTSQVLSSMLKNALKHQKAGALFTLKRKGTLLAMETGTGKTFTTLLSLAILHHRGSVDHALVTCPASAIGVWRREIKKWMPGTTLKFTLGSYEFSRFYFKYIRKAGYDALVADEIHKLKNHASQQSRRLAIIAKHVKFKYGLTATEVSESVIDLFGIFKTINPDLLSDKWKIFKKRYLESCGFGGFDVRITKKKEKELLELLEPHTYQVLSKDVFGKTVNPPVYLFAQLKGTQKKMYEQIEKRAVAKYDDFVVSTPRAITQVMRLQQITGGHVPTDDGDMLTFECGKGDVLNDFLKSWNRKKKLVIFARFIHELNLIKKICEQNKFSCYIFQSKKPEEDDDFQEKDHPQICISQVSKGGISRTLTRASVAIFFSRTFSFVDYQQAIGRVKARGVKKEPATPIFIITEGTVDEDIDEAIAKKETKAQFVKRFLKGLKKRG